MQSTLNQTLSQDSTNSRNTPYFFQVFNSPSAIYNYGVDAILLGMMDKEADAMDMAFSESVTTFLFSEQPTVLPGIDLLAMNLQRGRDHGLPGKNSVLFG